MFSIISRKLVDKEILDAVKTLRTTRGRESDRAFLDLRETFSPLIKSRFNAIKHIAENYDETKQLWHFVETQFSEILLERENSKTYKGNIQDLDRFKAYLKKMMSVKITEMGAREELGKSSPIRKVRDYSYAVKNAIKKFHRQYKRLPDFESKSDLDILAKILNVSMKRLEVLLSSLGQDVKSLQQQIGNEDDDGNAVLLIDSIRNTEPLPDVVFQDQELMDVFKQTIERYLPPDQRKVFTLYFLEGGKDDYSKEEIAQKLKMDPRRFRHLLDMGKEKLKNTPAVRELLTARKSIRLFKLATSNYNVVKINNEYEIKKSSELIEHLIKTIIKNDRN